MDTKSKDKLLGKNSIKKITKKILVEGNFTDENLYFLKKHIIKPIDALTYILCNKNNCPKNLAISINMCFELFLATLDDLKCVLKSFYLNHSSNKKVIYYSTQCLQNIDVSVAPNEWFHWMKQRIKGNVINIESRKVIYYQNHVRCFDILLPYIDQIENSFDEKIPSYGKLWYYYNKKMKIDATNLLYTAIIQKDIKLFNMIKDTYNEHFNNKIYEEITRLYLHEFSFLLTSNLIQPTLELLIRLTCMNDISWSNFKGYEYNSSFEHKMEKIKFVIEYSKGKYDEIYKRLEPLVEYNLNDEIAENIKTIDDLEEKFKEKYKKNLLVYNELYV